MNQYKNIFNLENEAVCRSKKKKQVSPYNQKLTL